MSKANTRRMEEFVSLVAKDFLPLGLQPYQREFLRAMERMRPREVSARRARKLRRRGVYCKFLGWTPNGKCRYLWSPGSHR